MPRGAEYVDGPPASDNAIESGENKIAGAPQEGQQVGSIDLIDRVLDVLEETELTLPNIGQLCFVRRSFRQSGSATSRYGRDEG